MIELATQRLRLRVHPDHGASLSRYDWRPATSADWTPVMRAVTPDDLERRGSAAAAMFVMLPFANRLPASRLIGKDREWSLTRNTDDPLPIHGIGWQHAWEVSEATPAGAVLRFRAEGGSEGPRFDARISYALNDASLTVGMVLKNTSDTAVAMGMGLHPFFPRLEQTRLTFRSVSVLGEGAGHIPDASLNWPEWLDFRRGRTVDGRWRNNAYPGWSRSAVIEQPDIGYRLHIGGDPVFGDAMLYVPENGADFAFEPQTHTSGASNPLESVDGRTAMRLVPEGEAIEGAVKFDVMEEPKP